MRRFTILVFICLVPVLATSCNTMVDFEIQENTQKYIFNPENTAYPQAEVEEFYNFCRREEARVTDYLIDKMDERLTLDALGNLAYTFAEMGRREGYLLFQAWTIVAVVEAHEYRGMATKEAKNKSMYAVLAMKMLDRVTRKGTAGIETWAPAPKLKTRKGQFLELLDWLEENAGYIRMETGPDGIPSYFFDASAFKMKRWVDEKTGEALSADVLVTEKRRLGKVVDFIRGFVERNVNE